MYLRGDSCQRFYFRRLLFAVFFIYTAQQAFGIEQTADLIASKVAIPALIEPYTSQLEPMSGMTTPQLLAIWVGGFEIIAGLMIAVNFGARFFDLLIIFVMVENFYFHDFWMRRRRIMPGR